MNLNLLRRVLAQPWAVSPETLGLFAGLVMREDKTSPRAEKDAQRSEGQKGYSPLNYESWAASMSPDLLPSVEGAHVVLAWGILGRGWDSIDRYFFDPVDTDQLVAAVEAAPSETVVLWFRSPGGIVTGIPEAGEALRNVAKTKRVLAFTDTLCASAAYWLAAQCESIHATPTAALGSIGVYTAFYDYSEYLASNGISVELFKAGRLKAMGLAGTSLDEEARALIQAEVDQAYAQFKSAVLRNRDLTEETMQGQTFQGRAALAANLADKQWRSAANFFNAVARGAV